MHISSINLVANLGALSVAGILYAAYIRNLQSQLKLKDERLSVAEQNIALWRDKALALEKQSPHSIEQTLNDRIRIREDELLRLSKDGETHRAEIEEKNAEVERLREELEVAQRFGRAISIYVREIENYRTVPASQLTLKDLGYVWVDSATLLITDPYHFVRPRENEVDRYPVLRHRLRDLETGEVFCMEDDAEKVIIDGLDKEHTIRELVEMGRWEELPQTDELPAVPETYIKGNLRPRKQNQIQNCTFYNGLPGAGVSIGTRGDGIYPVRAEFYEGEIRRIMIDFY
ncbi:hypothetical protein [Petrachloros mirabilis]